MQISEAFKPYWNRRFELSLEDDCIMWGNRVVVPNKWQKNVLDELHQVHFGIARIKAIARGYVWWPELNKQIEEMTKSCTHCQKVKNAPAVASLHPWTWPSKPWQRLHNDFAGPFQGQMFLILVDSHSKWPEVVPMKKTTADATITELRRLFSSYGLPEQVVSDNGPQFCVRRVQIFSQEQWCEAYLLLPMPPFFERGSGTPCTNLQEGNARTENEVILSAKINVIPTYISDNSTQYNNVAPCTLFLNRELRTRFDLMRPEISGNVAAK